MDGADTELGRWEPVSVEAATELLAGVPARWWIAGGWALDLFLGGRTRPHADLDVLVLRADLPAVRDRLAGWDLHAADPPGTLRPWAPDEELPAHVHDIWGRRTPADPWQLQLIVDDTRGGDWVYRGDPAIRRPVPTLDGPASVPGRAVLTPDVQLLHKSHRPRPKDEADFRAVLPALTGEQRSWLDAGLARTAPDHPWRSALSGPG